jgi:tRNA-2-methylthio-N6-dimethylallyladenosine synthase
MLLGHPPMSLPRVESRTSSASPPAAPKLHLVTFGCQMNKYDSERVEGRFLKAGYGLTAEIEQADVVVFNTCSVRDHAEERVWSWLGELKRHKVRRPDLVVGVMGCMAQRLEGEIFQRAGHVDLVVGTRAFQRLPELVEDLRAQRARAAASRPNGLSLTGMDERPDLEREGEQYRGGTLGYLTVMRGCDLNCSFCIVPSVRGRVLSRPPEEVLREARWMVERGAKVLCLLGQTVNSYGEDLPEVAPGQPRGRGRGGRPSLADLLYALQELPGLERIRLITLHPAYVTPALARALAECDKAERFLPLPVQSGSDAVLRAMKRGYNLDLYRRKVELLRQAVPDLELGSDWIVGHPLEREQDFAASEHFLEEIGFAVNYVFKYSPRPGTRSDGFEDDVSEEQKRERNARLLALAERVQRARHAAQLGREQELLVEEPYERRPGVWKGRTRHGLAFALEARDVSPGASVRARAEQASPYGLAGGLVCGERAGTAPAGAP